MPSYDCVSAKILEGNFPEFTMRVTCGNLTACGTGSSKKVAKENAAKEILATLKADPCSKETKAIENNTEVKTKVCMKNVLYSYFLLYFKHLTIELDREKFECFKIRIGQA